MSVVGGVFTECIVLCGMVPWGMVSGGYDSRVSMTPGGMILEYGYSSGGMVPPWTDRHL